jgi:putative protease
VFSRSGFTNGYFENKLGSKMFGTRSHDDVLAADSKTLKSLENLYKKPLKRVGLDFDFKLFGNGSAVLKVSDGIFSAEVFADNAFKGEKLSLDKESAKKNLCKTGDTPYYLRSLEFSNSDSMMLPLSTVNALRREVIDVISKKRRELKPIEFNDNFEFEKVKNEIKKPDIFVRVNDISQLPKDKLNEVTAVLLPLEKITEKDVEFLGGKLVAQLPRVKFFSEEKVLQKLKQVRLLGVKRAVISNIGDILLCKEANVEAIGGFGLNVTNSLSVKKYAQLGLSAVTLSPELTITKMREISPHTNVGIIAYGNLPLMVTRNCPAKNTVSCEKCKSGNRVLVDRKNVKFPVMCGLGYSEILNSTPIYLADKTNELLFNDFMILYFTTESEKEVSEIIDEYAYKHTKRENITRGLYYRGSF